MQCNCCPSQPPPAMSQKPSSLTDSVPLSSLTQFQEPEIKKCVSRQLRIHDAGTWCGRENGGIISRLAGRESGGSWLLDLCFVRSGRAHLSWFRMFYLGESSFTFYLCSCLLSSALELGYIPHNIVLLQSNSVDLNVLMQPRESHKVLSYYLKLHFL